VSEKQRRTGRRVGGQVCKQAAGKSMQACMQAVDAAVREDIMRGLCQVYLAVGEAVLPHVHSSAYRPIQHSNSCPTSVGKPNASGCRQS